MTRRRRASATEVCTAEQHGDTATVYDWWGCRCPAAREAHRLYRKRLREHRQPPANVSGLGSARRLQALVAIGYCWRDLAPHLHVSPQRVRQVAINLDGVVYRDTAEKVAVVFTRLAATRGPSKVAFTVARRNGWLPPLAWDDIDDPAARPSLGGSGDDIVDEVAVERVLAGEHLELTDNELMAVLQAGVARGDETLSRLALRLGVNYAGAKQMLGGELTPRRAKRARERELVAS